MKKGCILTETSTSIYLFGILKSIFYLHKVVVILFSSSAKAIDEYASLKSKATESNDEAMKVDPRLEAIVERMLNKYVDLLSLDSIAYLSFYVSLQFFSIQVHLGWKISSSYGNCN